MLLWLANLGFAGGGTGAALAFVQDLNTRLFVYLCDLYTTDTATSDLTTLMNRRLGELTGDYTARFQQLVQDATDAMS